MSPPAVVGRIVRPSVLIIELEVLMIRAVLIHISPLFIAFRILVDSLTIQPLVKGTTMVKYPIQYHANASFMSFLHYFCKKCITCFQILQIGHSVDITGGILVFILPVLQQFSLIVNDLTKMGIDIIIILNIIFMVRGRYKKRVKIDDLNPKILQIIHFIQNTLQVSAIELPHTHGCRVLIPVIYFCYTLTNITILIG